MESQVVRERMKIIAGHLGAAPQDISATATHIFPMSCSNGLNTVVRRCDNRLFFARQSSGVQGCFMRQGSSELNSSNILNSVIRRCDNRMFFARQGSDARGCFMRQESAELVSQPIEPLKANFSRSTDVLPSMQEVEQLQCMVESCRYEAEDMAPKFAKPDRGVGGYSNNYTKETSDTSESNGSKSSPRMDVVESGCSYLVMIELPGVPIDNIRVEVSDQSLTVTGNRSAHWMVGSASNGSISEFQRKEISEGPYQVVWGLPTSVNKERVSADFAHGLLRITLPKQ